MRLRPAEPDDRPFVIEMARLACTLDGRPLPAPDAPAVFTLLPRGDAGVIAVDDDGHPVGAAWWHLRDPPLLRGADGEPLPELVMAVVEEQRRKGIGTALVEALAAEAAKQFSALTLNVHIHSPATQLYTRTGFSVAGAGRGPFGVAMRRPLAVRA